jgi:hypothetical protein
MRSRPGPNGITCPPRRSVRVIRSPCKIRARPAWHGFPAGQIRRAVRFRIRRAVRFRLLHDRRRPPLRRQWSRTSANIAAGAPTPVTGPGAGRAMMLPTSIAQMGRPGPRGPVRPRAADDSRNWRRESHLAWLQRSAEELVAGAAPAPCDHAGWPVSFIHTRRRPMCSKPWRSARMSSSPDS